MNNKATNNSELSKFQEPMSNCCSFSFSEVSEIKDKQTGKVIISCRCDFCGDGSEVVDAE